MVLRRATYRLQLSRRFRLRDALRLVPYLDRLGVSHLYLSPLLRARPGSAHGYDGVDPTRINAEIGTEADLARLARELHRRGMGILLDIVPNHLWIEGGHNPWWNDVVRRRKKSAYARYFDVDWEASGKDLVYRRFFDLGGFAALRMEAPGVFERVHAKTFDWIRRGWIDALRVDHPDGLTDPWEYLARLRRRAAAFAKRRLPVYVEKILEHDEALRADWPVDGTTGYEFLNLVNGLFIDVRSAAVFRRDYRSLTGIKAPWRDVLYDSKKLVLETTMVGDVERLVRLVLRGARRLGLSLSRPETAAALTALVACFPVYRSYAAPRDRVVGQADRLLIKRGLTDALRRVPQLRPALRRLERILVGRAGREALLRFQQVTPPAMAKGLEDTALYRYVPLVSQNEVGGDPDRFGATPAEFHRKNQERLRRHPFNLLATATHDTKRGEGVRARINVLSEIPKEWFGAVRRWIRWNRTLKDRADAPDANDEYLLYQTLVGTWEAGRRPGAPVSRAYAQRIGDYLQKALCESKRRTAWIRRDAAYERSVARFVKALLLSPRGRRFRRDFSRFVEPVANAGKQNALAQTLLKIASPGVPDFYQGTVLWDLALVDPDNRRPVDFTLRKRLLTSIEDAREDAHFDQRKILVIMRALDHRRRDPALYTRGAYLPLAATGDPSRRIVAFARTRGKKVVLAVAARFWRRHGAVSRKTAIVLPPRLAGSYRDLLTNREFTTVRRGGRPILALKSALKELPVALLERKDW